MSALEFIPHEENRPEIEAFQFLDPQRAKDVAAVLAPYAPWSLRVTGPEFELEVDGIIVQRGDYIVRADRWSTDYTVVSFAKFRKAWRPKR